MIFSIATIFNIVIIIVLNFISVKVVNGDENNKNFGFCPPGATVNLTNAVRNNSGLITNDKLFFPDNLVSNQSGVIQGCVCDVKPCITVCPPLNNDKTKNNETMSKPEEEEEDENYVNYSAIPNVYDKNVELIDYNNDDEKTSSLKNRFHVLIWRPCDEENSYPLDVEDYPDSDEYFLLENGSIHLPQDDSEDAKPRNFTEYCFQKINSDNSSYVPRICSQPDTIHEIDKAVYIGGLLAVPFLIATVIVYSILPELNNIHGKTLRCYLCCIFLKNFTLAIDRIPAADRDAGPFCLSLEEIWTKKQRYGFVCNGSDLYRKRINTHSWWFNQTKSRCGCSLFSKYQSLHARFTIYFSFLASFFWLNVICFDIWWTFGGFGSSWIPSSRSDRKKFIGYSTYVWGATSIMTAICVAMEFSPNIPDSMISPGFRLRSCWFNSKSAEALYLYGPIAVTIVCNISMFISTSIKLYVQKKQTERDLNTGESRRRADNKQQFRFFLTLFLVMGITWSTDTISWLWEGPKYLWVFTDLINALHGIFIFVVMVCKPNILNSLKERFTQKKTTSCHESRLTRFKNWITPCAKSSSEDSVDSSQIIMSEILN